MTRTQLLGITLLFCSLAAARGQGLNAADSPAATRPATTGAADGAWSPALTGARRPLYRLHKSDVVDVTFNFAPEFNQTLTVQPDGFIGPRDIPEVYVEGMTLPEFQDAITKAYAGVLHGPEVTVTLKDFDKPYFIASGEVGHPGKYELRGDTTVTEALAMAGGLTRQAKHSQVVLFRRVSDSMAEAKVLDVKHMLNSRDLREDVNLKPGDLLFVPQNTISKLQRYLPVSNLGAYLSPAQF